jgi:uncharacterized protein DUF4124
MVTAMSHDPTLTMLRLLCALAPLLALPAEGGVYKCAGGNGAVVYQDSACAEGRELRNLEADPATLSVVPGTPVTRSAARPAPQPKPAKVRTAAVKSRGGDPSERKFLRTGMTEAEVLHRLGRPDLQLNSRRKEGRQWSYLPTAGDADTLTTVTFNGGAVIRVERTVVR